MVEVALYHKKSNTGRRLAARGLRLTFSETTTRVEPFDVGTNEELSKKRAFAVRDALVGAGIAEDRLVLEKPIQTEANLSGEDATARRVEVNMMGAK